MKNNKKLQTANQFSGCLENDMLDNCPTTKDLKKSGIDDNKDYSIKR